MNKKDFLRYLKWKLRMYSTEEVESAVNYYDELISDKVRDGMSEKDAVASLGDKKEIVRNLIATMDSESRVVRERRGSTAGAVAFGCLASPLLFPLAIVFTVLIFVVSVVWLSLVVSFGGVALMGLVGAVGNWLSFTGIASSLIQTGAGLVIFVIGACLCWALAYYGFRLVRSIFIGLRNAFFNRK